MNTQQLQQNIFVTGPASSGKTYLANYLKSIGVKAADTDEIPGLAKWINMQNEAVPYPEKADKQFLNDHWYVWDRKVLEQYINDNQPVAVLGVSDVDVLQFVGLFDKSFYLQITPEVAKERLSLKKNRLSQTDEQQQRVINDLADFDLKAKNNNFIMIDATQTPEKVWQQIQSNL